MKYNNAANGDVEQGNHVPKSGSAGPPHDGWPVGGPRVPSGVVRGCPLTREFLIVTFSVVPVDIFLCLLACSCLVCAYFIMVLMLGAVGVYP